MKLTQALIIAVLSALVAVSFASAGPGDYTVIEQLRSGAVTAEADNPAAAMDIFRGAEAAGIEAARTRAAEPVATPSPAVGAEIEAARSAEAAAERATGTTASATGIDWSDVAIGVGIGAGAAILLLATAMFIRRHPPTRYPPGRPPALGAR